MKCLVVHEQRRAWAIATRSAEYGDHGGFIGAGWFDELASSRDVHRHGLQIALFPTRKAAQERLPIVRSRYGFPRAIVVRVRIRIDEVRS